MSPKSTCVVFASYDYRATGTDVNAKSHRRLNESGNPGNRATLVNSQEDGRYGQLR